MNLSTFYSTDMHISLLITESDAMHMHTQIVVIPHLFRRKAVHYRVTLLHCCRGRASMARMRTRYEGGAARASLGVAILRGGARGTRCSKERTNGSSASTLECCEFCLSLQPSRLWDLHSTSTTRHSLSQCRRDGLIPSQSTSGNGMYIAHFRAGDCTEQRLLARLIQAKVNGDLVACETQR